MPVVAIVVNKDFREPASKEPAELLEAAENFRRLVMRHFPKSRADLEAGATLNLDAYNGKGVTVDLPALKGGA